MFLGGSGFPALPLLDRIIFVSKPKRFYSVWLGIPLLGLIGLIGLGFTLSFYQSLPSVVFRDVAGFPPPPDVTFVKSLWHVPTKWDDSYLECYASDATIDEILSRGFVPISPRDVINYGGTPDWWLPPAGPSVRIYATNTDDPDFRGNFSYFVSHKLLIYDPGSGNPGRRKVYLRYRRP